MWIWSDLFSLQFFNTDITDTHPLSETEKRTEKDDNLDLKDRHKQRETELGREKKGETDKDVCVLLNERGWGGCMCVVR